ncbi:MAG TPA: hypothetical protein VLZ53_12295 [Devosia sp.]|nr:hypothetical protein [Devosia sp.]
MTPVAHRSAAPNPGSRAAHRGGRGVIKPFAGLIEAVIVEDPAPISFPGCVARSHAQACWVWVYRDLAGDLIGMADIENGKFTVEALEPLLPQLMLRMHEALAKAEEDPEASRRLRAMLGSDEARNALPVLLNALRARALLDKAQAFGRALNSINDDNAISTALHSMPLQDPPLAALLFHAAIEQVANPSRLIASIIKTSGTFTETGMARLGLGPVLEAIMAHAQNQLYLLQPSGPFADVDLMCRGLDRYHRLIRSLTGYIEFSRGSRWTLTLSSITKQISDRIEPRMRDIVPDLILALRRGREGAVDRLDDDRVLAAISGIYLLNAIRDSRDSLALNALFDQAWVQSGEALETHLQRNLELLRQNPADPVVGKRLDAGIKMAEIRFNPEYAETLKRARIAAERRS